MDIYPYFNSPEIAMHCREIGKEFSPGEKQMLIAMSHKPMEDRLNGYHALLPETEGIIHPNDFFSTGMLDLHKYMLDMLTTEQRRVERLQNGNPAIGFYRAMASEQRERYSLSLDSPEYRSICYRTYTEAMNDLIERYQDKIGSFYYHFAIVYEEIGNGLTLKADIDHDGTIYRIQSNHNSFEELDEQTLRSTCGYIDLPTPFAKGDLVEVYDGFEKAGDLYVLDRFCYDDTERHAQLLKTGTDSDMVFHGYHMEKGFLRCHVGSTGYDTMRRVSESEYMKMEHFCNILLAVKDCLAGKVSLSSFAHVVNYAEYTSVPIGKAFFKLQEYEL